MKRGWHIHKDRCVNCHSEGGRNKTLTGTILAGRSRNIPADMALQFEGLDNFS
ncbi:hypothetical protein [Candidatus Marithrix sp. Canyon 246]|uniref:hypothetical protein n=1 Tax=Candidatus Marithrix sp. Canyon 246 TaxID=1827136 RepID=UPI00149608D9|nr:hypothetical protein [Candidatus Marithrix sp. Canyon 246]